MILFHSADKRCYYEYALQPNGNYNHDYISLDDSVLQKKIKKTFLTNYMYVPFHQKFALYIFDCH